ILTGDYPAAAASLGRALALVGDLLGQAETLSGLGLLQQLTGDHAAAAASLQRALTLFGDLGDLHGQAQALNSLGVAQQDTGDDPGRPAGGPDAVPGPGRPARPGLRAQRPRPGAAADRGLPARRR